MSATDTNYFLWFVLFAFFGIFLFIVVGALRKPKSGPIPHLEDRYRTFEHGIGASALDSPTAPHGCGRPRKSENESAIRAEDSAEKKKRCQMVRNLELIAAKKAVEKTGVFFCKNCWQYRPLTNSKVRGSRKICETCAASVKKSQKPYARRTKSSRMQNALSRAFMQSIAHALPKS